MIRKFDLAKTRAHRREQAMAGMPLLRGCPNTAAFAIIRHFDSLEAGQRLAFADQVSDLDEKQATSPAMTMDERAAFMRSLPLLHGLFGQEAPEKIAAARVLPVKLMAGLLNDAANAGTQAERDQAGLLAQAQRPVAGHADSLDELVSVSPRRLRKLVGDMLSRRFGAKATVVSSDHTRYIGSILEHAATLDILFANAGGRPMHQFAAILALARPDGMLFNALSYEAVWLTPARWDYVTEANADRAIEHLGLALEALAELV